QRPTSNNSGESEHLQDPDLLSNYVSLFNLRDLRSLSDFSLSYASKRINIPQEMQDYILPNVNRTMLENLHLNKC
ncbi:hypothetical protein RhiirC2_730778, partial [Rhizophagus irregularis]